MNKRLSALLVAFTATATVGFVAASTATTSTASSLSWTRCDIYDWDRTNYGSTTLNSTIGADFGRFASSLNLGDLPHGTQASADAAYLPTGSTSDRSLTCSFPIQGVGSGSGWHVIENSALPDVVILTLTSGGVRYSLQAQIRPTGTSSGYEVVRLAVARI